MFYFECAVQPSYSNTDHAWKLIC